MTELSYRKPPIVEAVIEFRFTETASPKSIEKLIHKLKSTHPVLQSVGRLQVESNRTEATMNIGKRLSNNESTNLIVLTLNTFAVSRLAPYLGWREFEPRIRDTWGEWKKQTECKTLSRIGLRYINRIDIPLDRQESKIEPSDFLSCYVHSPKVLKGGYEKYLFQQSGAVSDSRFNYVLNSGVVDSPLINHTGLLLDLDLCVSNDLPANDDALFKVLGEMHDCKNQIFLACVTEKAKRLFE